MKAGPLLVISLGAILSLRVPATGYAIPPASSKPLEQEQILELVKSFVPSARLARLVRERGIDFEPSEAFLLELKRAGAKEVLLKALREAKPVSAQPANDATPAPAAKREAQQGPADGPPANQPGAGTSSVELPPARQGDGTPPPALPETAAAHIALGKQLSEQGKLDDALAQYRQAAKLEPDNIEAHRELSRLLFQKGDVGAAIAEYRELARLAPDDNGVRVNLGLALYSQGDVAGAIREYREALRLKPDDPGAHSLLAAGLKRHGELDAAIAEYRAAVRLDPNFAAAHHDLGAALEAKGDRQGALAEYRQALALNPHDPQFKSDYERLAPKN